MLAYVLALVIGLGSLAMYMAAFFFPEVHRKSDFLWSAVGLFYALVLWVCAGRITGGVLLGQLASVALLGWLGWETLNLRRERALPEDRTQISPQVQAKMKGFSLSELGQNLQQQLSNRSKKKQPETKTPATVTTATENKATPTSGATVTEQQAETTQVATSPTPVDEPAADGKKMSESPELVPPNPPDPELVAAAQNTPDEAAAQPIEAVSPAVEVEVESIPPAEPPGDGDPQMRQNPPEADVATEGVPIDPENPPKLS